MALDVDTLRTVPLLADLPTKELKRLCANLRERSHEDGATVVEEGSGGIGFFFILEGAASVSVSGQPRGALRAGDHFGELGLLDDRYGRFATVTADGPLRTAALTAWEFKSLIREHPDMAWEIMRTMAKRINETQHAVTAA